ncbi:MAG TPA: hypothetical protein VNR64_06185 [Vicinamibacterales bacterium]|nr:hypothetical protein [Vicinamibacterales bacterium]
MRGVGLIEVIVATALLAVMALGVAPLLAAAVRSNAEARLQLDAAAAATERMEQLLAAPFAAPISPPDSLTFDDPGFNDVVASPAGTLTRRWSTTPYAADPADTRVLSVVVCTPGRPRLTIVTTVRTRTGP